MLEVQIPGNQKQLNLTEVQMYMSTKDNCHNGMEVCMTVCTFIIHIKRFAT
jgi:hypothetical protein